MKKVKLLFAAAALLLVTIGVFAGRAKFIAQDIYVTVGATEYKISSSALTDQLQTNNPGGLGTQARLQSSFGGGAAYDLYAKDGSSQIPLFTQSF